MIVKNGLVLDPDGQFRIHDLFIDHTHTLAADAFMLTEEERTVFDATGLTILPGLVDVHIHGAVGRDFCDADAEGLAEMASYLKSCGITSFCPTSMTLPADTLKEIFATAKEVPSDSSHSRVVGIHMEGPYISPAKKGAQKEDYIRNPDVASFHELMEASSGLVRLITIAPELPGSMEFIRDCHDEVTISLGHSVADYTIASQAFENGACHVTHLFNAMMPLAHRDPGIIGAAFDHDNVMVEVICDGIHISPSVIRMIFSLFGEDRVILISDAMRATGMEDGMYELGGQDVIKKGNRATLKDGTLAGSATNLFDCMRHAVSFGIPLSSAVKAASANPARSIGNSRIGAIAPGMEADLLLVDNDLTLQRVL